MTAAKATDNETICFMAIDDVIKTISIKFPQYPSFGERFKAHCIEEAFEEIEVLIDDVAEGFAESVILDSISQDMEIKNIDKEPLCTSIHYALSTYSPPPKSLNLVELDTKVATKEVYAMKEMVRKQVTVLTPDSCKDEVILKVLIIGENNHFPLLIYLIDTYTRYRLLEYQKLFKKLHQIKNNKKRRKFIAKKFRIELTDFFKECHAMRKIKKKSGSDAQFEKILIWYNYTISATLYRHIPIGGTVLNMNPSQISYKINDSILIYAKYYISILIAVNNMLQDSMTKLPLQIDIWVIPKAMKQINEHENDDEIDELSDDIDDDSEEVSDDENYCNVLEINKLDQRLKFTDNLIVKGVRNKEIEALSNIFCEVCKNVIKRQRSKRMVIIIDRRIDRENVVENNENYSNLSVNDKDCEDTLYAFLPKNTQNIPSGKYLHESMWNLSRTEVLPSENGKIPSEDSEHWDNNALYPPRDVSNMCLLSIHVHNENVIRAYWYINMSITRFFVNDMVNIWPLYFVEKDANRDQDEIPKYQDIDEIIDLINNHSNELPLKDSNFDIFFEENTKIKPCMAYAQTFKFKILIFGYIRDIYENQQKLLPIEMINLCYKYYVQPFEMMHFTPTPIYYFEIN